MLIVNARLITWDDNNSILPEHGLRIQNGRIDAIGPQSELLAEHPHDERLDAGGQIVMPGNINTHGHFYGAFSRGLAVPGDQPFNLPTILAKLWWPFDKAMNAEDVRYSALVGLVDAIKHGTTTLFDHHSSPNCISGSLDIIADAVDQAGLRSVLCFEVTDRDGSERAAAGIAENVRFFKRCLDETVAEGRVAANIGMHACMTITEKTLEAVRSASPEEAGFHIHVAEHEYDEYRSLKEAGVRSIDRLERHGLLNDRTIIAHAVQLDHREVDLLARHGPTISHQPRSNMNTGSGVAEVEAYLRAGVPVSIGNDGLSNTMWKEWEFAYLVPKVKHRDARRMPGDLVVRMGVHNGRALAAKYFSQAPIGILEAGAFADLIFVDYRPPTPMTPENLPWHIIFGFNESMITTTIVDGKVLMRDRKLLTLDEEEISARSRELSSEFWERYRAAVPDVAILG